MPANDLIKSIRSLLIPVHRAGWPFIAVFAVVALILMALSEPLGWLGLLATAWCAYFFRDPPRVTPQRAGLVVSPADGRVSSIAEVAPPAEMDLGEEKRVRISVFMNVFDCHVNRAPVAGRVVRVAYRPGKFINAELDKASEDNERNALVLAMADGAEIGVVQIAGLVARRIVGFVDEGDELAAGERIGLIRFGSRLDIYLPPGRAALVGVGQRAIAGETVLADLAGGEGARAFRRD